MASLVFTRSMDHIATIFSIVPVDTTIVNALALRWNDFEDAVQFMVARENGITYIVTRPESRGLYRISGERKIIC